MTATLASPKPRAFYASDATRQSFWGHKLVTNDDGTTSIEGIEIFKVGTFRDSLGDQQTWEVEHLEQMAANFDLLQSKQVLVNVPVREDHSFSVKNVIGYFTRLYVKDDKLLADVLITEPAGAEKIARTTYRSVSNEVGIYESNDGAMYWPVVFGFAYVDLPAVEGLHSKTTNGVAVYSRTTNTTKEALVATETDKAGDQTETPGAAAPHQFRVAGVVTSDFTKVQTHIDSLETQVSALSEAQKQADQKYRKDFVQKLVDDKLIAATQRDATEKFALDLDATAFGAWEGTWEGAPVVTLLQEHGKDQSGVTPTEKQAKDSEIEVLRATVEHSRRAGITGDKLAKTKAAIRLAELTKN